MFGRAGWVCAVLVASVGSVPGSVYAHGAPPAAYALLAADAEGALAVRLSAGLAVRRAHERFQFVCPALWGDEYSPPAVALADGSILVGATEGLVLLSPDGSIRPHPSERALGPSTELAQTEQATFALRNVQGQSELLALTPTDVEVLWRDHRTWYSLRAQPSQLVLLRVEGMMVEQLTLSNSGEQRDLRQALMTRPVDYAFARGSSGAAYALVLSQTGSELGRLEGGGFVSIVREAASIAGPLADAQGELLAVDGQLQQLRDGVLTALDDTTYVGCLEQGAGQSYACTRTGLARVEDSTVGASLFELSWLVAPDLDQLEDSKARQRCEYQWQDLRFDLVAVGILLPSEQPPPDPPEDAATPSDELDAGALEPAEAGVGSRPRARSSCSALPGDSLRVSLAPLLLLVLALFVLRSPRRRARER